MGCCESKNARYNIGDDDKNSDIAITDIVAYGKELETQEKKNKGLSDDINGNVTVNMEQTQDNVKIDESEFSDVDLNDHQDTDNFETAKLEISDLKSTESRTNDDTVDDTEKAVVSLPPPRPPQKLRKDLIPDVNVFARIDKDADTVPHMEHETVEALAKHLTDD
ncbi:uncharacterized protein LOC117342356 [Pecten maximus]|uniref:uncharacterized protein LOC117342356 n=1 Tax=Pecten maximus TaxID=6579 RepID=UPI0014590E90|nr:uncharacterized protein LOC117342356 [Pecten maximus]XP_033760391.1 uncharacterized protein LOC117342356 [Pecten maximus]